MKRVALATLALAAITAAPAQAQRKPAPKLEYPAVIDAVTRVASNGCEQRRVRILNHPDHRSFFHKGYCYPPQPRNCMVRAHGRNIQWGDCGPVSYMLRFEYIPEVGYVTIDLYCRSSRIAVVQVLDYVPGHLTKQWHLKHDQRRSKPVVCVWGKPR
jgi:hypothetical protein